MYGSTWITSGAGSVLCLWGPAGDTLLSLRHLKQPEEHVGPFTVEVNHLTGDVSRVGAREPLGVVREAAEVGATARDVASACRGAESSADLQWAQRLLADLERRGLLVRQKRAKVTDPDRFRVRHSRASSSYVVSPRLMTRGSLEPF